MTTIVASNGPSARLNVGVRSRFSRFFVNGVTDLSYGNETGPGKTEKIEI